jgi:hypothetical protein
MTIEQLRATLPEKTFAELKKFLDRLTPEAREEWLRFREDKVTLAPRAGDPAPDFELPRRGSFERVRLSSFAGKRPVALIFGSYT